MSLPNSHNLPIHSKSPLIASKQIYRLPNGNSTSIRMSDQNEYLKKKENNKINISQSTSHLMPKKVSLDAVNGINQIGLLEENVKEFMSSCAKHSKKKAKYYIKDGNQKNVNKIELFCSKCALDLALKGIKVEKFLNHEEKYRKSIIDEFLNKICETKAFCSQIKVDILKQKSENIAIQSFQTECLKDFFTALESMIQNEKTSILSEFQGSSALNLNKMEEEFNKIGSINDEIDRFQDDINQNYPKIINKMDLEPFLEIMQKYYDKLKSLRDLLEVKVFDSNPSSVKIHDFRNPCNEFYESLKILIRSFLGLNTKKYGETMNEGAKISLKTGNSQEISSNKEILMKNFNQIENNEKKINFDSDSFKNFNNKIQEILLNKNNFECENVQKPSCYNEIVQKNYNINDNMQKKLNNCDEPNQIINNNENFQKDLSKNNEFQQKNLNLREISHKIQNYANIQRINDNKNSKKQVNFDENTHKKLLEIEEHTKKIFITPENQEVLRDKTTEVLNYDSILRKTSFSNKETQEKIIQEMMSQTQRNPHIIANTAENIYSNLLSNMSIKKGNNCATKGFFSGLGKNYKTFENNKGNTNITVNKNVMHSEPKLGSIHMNIGNNIK